MPLFMHLFIETIVDVIGDYNYGFQVVVEHVGMTKQNHYMIDRVLITKLINHKSDYTNIWVRGTF